MSPVSNHIADKAAWIAALRPDDEERRSAVEHARGCAACAKAMEEGEQLIKLLDAQPAPPPPPPETLMRVREVIAADLSRGSIRDRDAPAALENDVSWWRAIQPAVVVASAWIVELSIAKKLVRDRSSVAISAALAITAVVVAVAAQLRPHLVRAIAIILSAGAAIALGSAAGLNEAIGVKCAFSELVAGVLPWGFAAWQARRAATHLIPARAGALAASGALAGHAALHLSCPVAHETAHLLVFHLGGVLLAAAVGTFAAPKIARAAT